MKKSLSLFLAIIITATTLCMGVSAQSNKLTLEETLYQGYKNYQAEIDVSQFGILWDDVYDELVPTVRSFEHLYPDIFHRGGGISVRAHYVNGKQYVKSVVASYAITADEYKRKLRSFNFWVDEIAGLVDKNASELEQILFVHEYFVANFEYDLDYEIYDAYNFFKEKRVFVRHIPRPLPLL